MWPYFTVPFEGHIRQVWLYNLVVKIEIHYNIIVFQDPLPTALRPMLVPKDGVFVQLEERVRSNIRSKTCFAWLTIEHEL